MNTDAAASIHDTQDSIIKRFTRFDDWMDTYEHLIALGREHHGIPSETRSEGNALAGCQSQVWMYAEAEGERIRFYADSDSLITKGILSLLLAVFDNRSASEIEASDLYLFDRIGLSSHLSPIRRNGLALMVKQIYILAADHSKE